MKKLAIAGALMLLAGCAEVENYNNELVKPPRRTGWRATGRPKGRNVRWSVRKR